MMSWENLLNSERLGHRPAKIEGGRSPFNSDHDKVIFSGSFRRLARKTQVHPLATNDHVHNRLTHSLEVASVGRTLGIAVGDALKKKGSLPSAITPADVGDIVQTACLAHDIGNPPFGHTGEEAIRHWFKSTEAAPFINGLNPDQICDLQNFEGNAQGFRVLTCSEFHPYEGGLRLTYASLAAFIKYPWTSVPAVGNRRPKTNKYGVFQADLDYFREVANATGLISKSSDDWFCRHPLVHLMELADDFCYALLDLEDGMDMGILSWEEVFEVLKPVLDQTKLQNLEKELARFKPGRRPPLIRGKVISAFVDSAVKAFVENEEAILSGQHEEILSLCDDKISTCVKAAKNLAKSKIFSHPRKIELEIGAYTTISTLMEVLCHAAVEHVIGNDQSYRSSRVLDLVGKNTFHPAVANSGANQGDRRYLALMRIVDFVSGMTDNYATHLARQFSGMGEVR